ncbi:NEW3 domain-containing protein [Methanoplanus limicola]|uniref:Alpha-galactosidase n=1 Tax=Methanoplanus limicola DSM 2279 TaxID=937775 RepID=H1Z068_9EURY|nr:NEW3 domain-containing protein [Methanoplanus limicola]EHQ36160.1 alpha-galactosidase [Methanoplanus limicola DSM 2279]
MMTENKFLRIFKLSIIFLLISSVFMPTVVSADSGQNVELSCTYPGKIVEAGETLKFELNIKNNEGTYSKKLDYDTFKGEEGWKFRFYSGDFEIDRVALTEGQSITVTFEIDTDGDTAVGTYPVRVRIDDARMWLYVIIDRTHAGESGVLKAVVVNDQDEKIKGAKIGVFRENTDAEVTSVYTSADGEVRTEVEQGEYYLKIECSGYSTKTKDEISINSGYTTDAGTIMLEKKNFGLNIDVKSPVVTASVGDKPLFELKLSNVGKSDDLFELGGEGLPDGWYFRYKENKDSGAGVSRIFIESGAEKTVYLEVIPPYSAGKGDYEFQALVTSSDGEYREDLEAKISGNIGMSVFSDKYRYELTKGDSVDVPVRIENTGSGESLTNVHIEVSAPEGWNVKSVPETIPSIGPGERKTVNLKVIPPASIAASEYKITVKVVSDQEEESDDIRIIVNESSLIGIFGILLLVCAAGGVYYFFRKYERR